MYSDELSRIEDFICSRCAFKKNCEIRAYFCPAARKIAKVMDRLKQLLEVVE